MINFISLLVLRERIELPPKPCKDPVLPLYEQRLHILIVTGLEPAYANLEGLCLIQLSYTTIYSEQAGFEPAHLLRGLAV